MHHYSSEPTMLLIATVYGSGTYNQNVYSPASTTQTGGGNQTTTTSNTSTTSTGAQSPTNSSGAANSNAGTNGQPSNENSSGNSTGLPSTTGQTLQPSPVTKDQSAHMPYIIGGTGLALSVFVTLLVRILMRKA